MKTTLFIGLIAMLSIGCGKKLPETNPENALRLTYSPGEIHNKAMTHGKALFATNPGFADADEARDGINTALNNFVVSSFGTRAKDTATYYAQSEQTAEVLKGMPSGWQRYIPQQLDRLETVGAISSAERALMDDLVNHLTSSAPNYRKELLVESVVIDFEGLATTDQTQLGGGLVSIAEHSTDWWIEEIDGEAEDVGEKIFADLAGAIHGALVVLGTDLFDGDGGVDWGNVLDGAISGAINASFGIVVGWINIF